MPLTTNFKNKLLSAICGKQYFTQSIYAALATAVDAAAGTFTEVSEGSYTRVAVAEYSSNNTGRNLMDAPSEGTITNKETIYFPEVTEENGWGNGANIAYVVLCSGKNKGVQDMIGYAQIVDDEDHVTTLQIRKNTVPLIRTSKFTLGFVDAVAPSTPAEE